VRRVPVQFVEYRNAGEITAAAAKDAWDIAFMPHERTVARSVKNASLEADGAARRALDNAAFATAVVATPAVNR